MTDNDETAALLKHLTRPPILHATAALGLTDAEVARRLGVHVVQVSDWVLGKRPIPRARHVALLLLVGLRLGVLDHSVPMRSERDRARRELVRGAAVRALQLALQELGPVPQEIYTAVLIDHGRPGFLERFEATDTDAEPQDPVRALIAELLSEEDAA